MQVRRDLEMVDEDVFLAGEKVRPGLYRQVGSGREVRIDHDDFLPASLDGKVACYLLVQNKWGEMSGRSQPTV